MKSSYEIIKLKKKTEAVIKKGVLQNCYENFKKQYSVTYNLDKVYGK